MYTEVSYLFSLGQQYKANNVSATTKVIRAIKFGRGEGRKLIRQMSVCVWTYSEK